MNNEIQNSQDFGRDHKAETPCAGEIWLIERLIRRDCPEGELKEIIYTLNILFCEHALKPLYDILTDKRCSFRIRAEAAKAISVIGPSREIIESLEVLAMKGTWMERQLAKFALLVWKPN